MHAVFVVGGALGVPVIKRGDVERCYKSIGMVEGVLIERWREWGKEVGKKRGSRALYHPRSGRTQRIPV